MNTDIEISVIIPVYNSEINIAKTINSICLNKFKKIEFIFINDGSTDSSYDILKVFEKNDSRIRLLNQTNKGVSVARNKGIKFSSGNYITFVDSDDIVTEDYFETLYRKMSETNLDILVTTVTWLDENKSQKKILPFPNDIIFNSSYCRSQIMANLLSCEDLFSVWGKIYKSSFIKKNKILFPQDLKFEEDAIFNINAFQNCTAVSFTDYSGYNYISNDLSVSRSIDYLKKTEIAIEGYLINYKYLFNLSLSNKEIITHKTFRLVTKVSYIIFNLMIDKSLKINEVFKIGREIIQNKKIKKAFKLFKEGSLKLKPFELIIFRVVLNQSVFTFYLITFLLRSLYNKRFLTFLRKINKLWAS